MNSDIQPPNGEPGDRNEQDDLPIGNPGQLPPSSHSTTGAVAKFLEDIYGALFTPNQTFASLRSQPSIIGGLCAIAIPNILECIRTGKSPLQIPLTLTVALAGWLTFALLLQRLAMVFQRSDHLVDLRVLLTLTAFGSLPWIFIGPALSLGGQLGSILALVVMLWFLISQVRAASVAIGISTERLLLLVPLAIAGGVVAIIWASNVIGLLVSVAGY
jgi:hypothetical protein